MAKRRRARDVRKPHKHERKRRDRDKIQDEDEEIEERPVHRKSGMMRDKSRRNDILVVVTAVIFIIAVIGVYFVYDQYLKE